MSEPCLRGAARREPAYFDTVAWTRDLRTRSRLTTEQLTYLGRAEGWADGPEPRSGLTALPPCRAWSRGGAVLPIAHQVASGAASNLRQHPGREVPPRRESRGPRRTSREPRGCCPRCPGRSRSERPRNSPTPFNYTPCVSWRPPNERADADRRGLLAVSPRSRLQGQVEPERLVDPGHEVPRNDAKSDPHTVEGDGPDLLRLRL